MGKLICPICRKTQGVLIQSGTVFTGKNQYEICHRHDIKTYYKTAGVEEEVYSLKNVVIDEKKRIYLNAFVGFISITESYHRSSLSCVYLRLR